MTAPRRRILLVLALLGLAATVAAIGFLGSGLGLASPESRLAGILALLLLVTVCALAWVLRKGRRAPEAKAPAPAPPAEVDRVKSQVREAVRTIRTSHLGRTRGTAALYELPWLLVLGHPGAGKTEVVHRSGLAFPLSRNGAASGLDDPKYCRWNFATECVVLDTPGRYSAGGSDAAEWRTFLGLLRSSRPGGPLEAVLVTVELPDLLEASSTAVAAKIRQVRRSLDEVGQVLGAKVPVYLLFTKMDLLQGFTAFFEGLGEEERREAWGATLPHDQGPGFDPLDALDTHLATLHQGLAALGSVALARSPDRAGRPEFVTFPMEFRRLGLQVRILAEHLVGRDPYHARPFIRGFYFTSALQGEGPEAASMAGLAAAFDLKAPGSPASGPSRPHFLEQLFRQVILPDRFLARHLEPPRRTWARTGWLGAALAVLALVSGAWARSFAGNRRLCATAAAEAREARALAAGPRLEHRLKGLMVLQLRLEQLRRHRLEGRPWQLGWGLYQGPELERTLRSRYFAGIRELMLDPVREDLERILAGPQPTPPRPRRAPPRQPAPEPRILRVAHVLPAAAPRPAGARPDPAAERLYATLKTYLMLGDRTRMEAAHLADQLPRCWRPWLKARGGAELLPMAERAVAFYVSQIGEPDLPLIPNRPELVAAARRRLRAHTRLLSPLEQAYAELKARANTEFEALTAGRILHDRDLDLLAAGHAVPGAFTREACEKFFRPAIRDAGRHGLDFADWVLAGPAVRVGGTGQEVQAALEALYKAEFTREWDAFIQSLLIKGFGDPGGASAALGRLGDPQNSPLKLLLARAAFETAWDNPAELVKALANVKAGVLARAAKVAGPPAPARFGQVGGHFSSLAVVAGPGEGGAVALDGYLQVLQKARTRMGAIALSGDPGAGARDLIQGTLLGAGSELAEAHQYVETVLLSRVDGHGRELLRPVLLRPLVQAFESLLPAAEEEINRAWTHQVWGPWSALAPRYPFSDAAPEAPLADIQKFLKPGEGTLARFVDKHLGALVARQGDAIAPRFWAGRGVAFSEDFLRGISRLIQASTRLQDPAPSRFELQPVPAPGMREISLEIDGQHLLYRNGPQAWTPFAWPGPSTFQGARLAVVGAAGGGAQVAGAQGRLGLLRLLEQARIEDAGASSHALEWTFQPPWQPGACRIRFNFRQVSGADPLQYAALRHLSLPPRATR